jgi:ABC-2 type transport system permease protein
MNLRLVMSHASLVALAIARTPAFAVPTILFPAMFYTIFALQFARGNPGIADQMLASYVAFAVMGVAVFQFGVSIAAERGRPFERYLRSLPVRPEERFAARVLVAVGFAAVAGLFVALIGALFTPVTFTAVQWVQLAVYALAGAVPFVMMGLAIAYLVPAAGALPVTNIIYLLCAFAGGLWMPPQFLPNFAAVISSYLPTRAYGEVLWGIALPGHDVARWFIMLAIFAVAFSVLAIAGYRRDEKSRYA